MSRFPEFGSRLTCWERRMNDADRRIRDLELRGVILEQGSNQAEASLNPTAPSLPRQLFWVTATGCNGLALASEPLTARLAWGAVTGVGGSQPDGIADAFETQSLTTDSSGYVQWSGLWPQWLSPSGSVLTLGNYYLLSKSGGNYYYDPAGSYSGYLQHQLITNEQTKYAGYGYSTGYSDGCNPGNNNWYYLTGTGYICWTGLVRPVSAHTLTVTGGGGGTLSSGGSLTATRVGNSWNWTGSTWSGTTTGTYHVFWSLNYTTKVLSASVYHISVFGGDAPVTTTSEGQSGVLYATSTATPTITSSPFSAAYNFSGTTVGTLTGIGTVTLTEP